MLVTEQVCDFLSAVIARQHVVDGQTAAGLPVPVTP
jgi:hypothetical protein